MHIFIFSACPPKSDLPLQSSATPSCPNVQLASHEQEQLDLPLEPPATKKHKQDCNKKCTSYVSAKGGKVSMHEDCSIGITDTHSLQCHWHVQGLWISDLDLRYRDRSVMKRGMLCDRHMYAVHELLRNQFPLLQGLQSTLLSQRAFKPIQLFSSHCTKGMSICYEFAYFLGVLKFSC